RKRFVSLKSLTGDGMASLVEGPILEQDWQSEASEVKAALAAGACLRNGTGIETEAGEQDHWGAVIDQVAAMQRLGNNWDGLGAAAPSNELLASAVGLAGLLKQRGAAAPTRVVPGTDGAVIFEWQFPDGTYGEIELLRPFYAEVMLLQPGQPAR